MPDLDLFPLGGIDTVSKDTDLVVVDNGRRKRIVFSRDIVNMDVWPEGDATMRPGLRKLSNAKLRSLWRSTVHNDVFAIESGWWVRVNPDWLTEPLVEVGGDDVYHIELNQKVYAATQRGVYTFNGSVAEPLAIHEPDAPVVQTTDGSFVEGEYGFAIAWLRGEVESPLSFEQRLTVIGGVTVVIPMCFDDSVTGVRLYATSADGGELARVGDYPIGTITIELPTLPRLGKAPAFRHKSPMPTGKYLRYWRGRLLTVTGRRINFSDALAYHIHDPRHGFIDMPQRVTFVEPVRGGLWVGQIDHVCFIQGESLDNLSIVRMSDTAPVPGSSISVEEKGGESALWLSEDGYHIGSPDGQLSSPQSPRINGIFASSGQTVRGKNRVLTLTQSV